MQHANKKKREEMTHAKMVIKTRQALKEKVVGEETQNVIVNIL